jgi:alcohol dehydrogenase
MCGMVHALGHSVGAICNIPHGMAMSIFLPIGLEYNLEKTEKYVAELLLPFGGMEEYTKTPEERRAARTIVLIRKLQQNLYDLCGLPRNLKEAGVPRNKLETIAQTAINDGTLTFNPLEMDEKDAMNVLNEAYTW